MSKTELKLQSIYKSLSRVERRLADYILAERERVPLLPVKEIARGGGVSVAAVSRLARKLGYRRLQELKLDLARQDPPAAGYFYRAIQEGDSEEELVEKVFLGNRRSLEDTLALLDRKALAAAVQRMARARRLLFVGIGSSGFIAREAAMRFSLLDLPAQALTDPSEIFFRVSAAGVRDAAVGISHSGRTLITVRALELARGRGAATVGIANYLDSPLAAAAGFFFCTSFPESRVTVTALSSRIAQLCIVDAMYLLAARLRRGPLDYEQINLGMEGLLRLPERS